MCKNGPHRQTHSHRLHIKARTPLFSPFFAPSICIYTRTLSTDSYTTGVNKLRLCHVQIFRFIRQVSKRRPASQISCVMLGFAQFLQGGMLNRDVSGFGLNRVHSRNVLCVGFLVQKLIWTNTYYCTSKHNR